VPRSRSRWVMFTAVLPPRLFACGHLLSLANEPEIDDNVNDLHLGMIVLCWQT
jgi:hypothetical protein